MPRRTDLHRILLLGSGPIVIGQGAEFDYSGTQAAKALREEGFEVVLVNSNPATIMTDPEFADRTYIEPVTPEFVELVIAREHPDALLPTMGGQTALNVALELADRGVLAQSRRGADRRQCAGDPGGGGPRVVRRRDAEDRAWRFPSAASRRRWTRPRRCWSASGSRRSSVPRSRWAALAVASRTTATEYEEVVRRGLDMSPTHQVLVEQSVLGWKEYELEVMRDHDDNVVIVCSIENLDPMGVHTGDSITVAPAMTLTDREYQRMRDAALAVIREIGVDAGGCNIQFAVNPRDGTMLVIEMNPRVSRSSALASKATGYPIARIGAKLAVGYRLDEIANDITQHHAGVVRASAGLCGRQSAAVRVREVRGRGSPADHADEVGWRVDGDRADLQGSVPEGIARPGVGADRDGWSGRRRRTTGSPTRASRPCAARCGSRHRSGCSRSSARSSRGFRSPTFIEITGVDPWFLCEMQQLVEAEVLVSGPRGG